MPKQAIELMFGSYRRQLLAQLLLRPDEKFHVRELARMTGISAGSSHRELKAMSESGLLLREHAGNQVLYQANRACPVYNELAAIFRKTIGMATLLKDALAGLSDKIELAFVFGSMASGTQDLTSDVDVLVLGDLSLREGVQALSPLQVTLGRQINPVVMTTDKFVDRKGRKDRFVMRVLEEPRTFVIGDDDELAKLVEDRSAG
ncbi:MAG: nucleotidyltransferase domain-containing protein [Woeseia sp.]